MATGCYTLQPIYSRNNKLLRETGLFFFTVENIVMVYRGNKYHPSKRDLTGLPT